MGVRRFRQSRRRLSLSKERPCTGSNVSAGTWEEARKRHRDTPVNLKCRRVTCSLRRQAVKKTRRREAREMEYFKSSLKSVLGTAPAGTQPTGADTVSGTDRQLRSSRALGYFPTAFWINAACLR